METARCSYRSIFCMWAATADQLSAVNQQKFTATIFAGDTMLFGFSPDYYQNYLLKNLEGSDDVFFDLLGVEGEGVSEDGAPGAGMTARFLETEEMKGAPEELIFGVRDASGSASRRKEPGEARRMSGTSPGVYHQNTAGAAGFLTFPGDANTMRG